MSKKKVSKDKAMGLVRRALQLATDHLSGNRDESVPEEFDIHVIDFVVILRDMLASLEESGSSHAYIGDPCMRQPIRDGWPSGTELGAAITVAERAYVSSFTGTT